MARNSCFIVRVLCVPLTWHFSPCDSWSQGCWSCCQCLLQPRQPPQCLHAHGESLLLCVCRGAQVCVWQISQWHSKVRLTWCWCLGFFGGFEFNFLFLAMHWCLFIIFIAGPATPSSILPTRGQEKPISWQRSSPRLIAFFFSILAEFWGTVHSTEE